MHFASLDIFYLIFAGCTHLIQAVTVTWGVGEFWYEPSTMYINGVHIVDVPEQGSLTTHTLPDDARVIAWQFRIVLDITKKWFQVTYSNSWSSRDYQCWTCTGTDVSQLNWADIEYDDSSWNQPQQSSHIQFDWVSPAVQTIYCRHTLPVPDVAGAPKFLLSYNQAIPIAVADKLQDENTGTCVAASEIYGAAMTTAIKVNPASYTGSECPKNGPTTRLEVTSQGSGSNGTVWCHFDYTPASCPTCCAGCDKPVLLVFRTSEANVNICEID